jgi:hypothetical protein
MLEDGDRFPSDWTPPDHPRECGCVVSTTPDSAKVVRQFDAAPRPQKLAKTKSADSGAMRFVCAPCHFHAMADHPERSLCPILGSTPRACPLSL